MRHNKFKIIFFNIIFFIIIFMSKNCYAASSKISVSPSTAKVGDTITVTISGNTASWNVNLVASGPAKANGSTSFSNATESGENEDVTIGTVKYTATGAGEIKFSLSGQLVNGDYTSSNASGSASVKIEDEKEEPAQPTTPTTPTQTTTLPATEKPTEPTFKQVNEIVYVNQDVVNVRSTWSSEGGKYGQLKKGDSITRTGVSSETINGYVWSRISYNGKTAYVISSALTTTKVEVKDDEKEEGKKDEKSANKALKELIVNDYEITPAFNAETTKYSLTLEEKDAKVETLEITATPQDEKATVKIEGNENFKVGNNIVKITVTAEDGTTRMYSITVSKTADGSLVERLKLYTLQIGAGTMVPEFDPDITSYTITVEDPTTVKAEEIIAKANNVDITVTTAETQASENGDKVITIMLESKDGKETGVYQINVKKAIANQAPLIEGKSDNSIYYILGVIIGVLLILIVLVIIAIKKTSDDEEDDYDYNENRVDDTYDYSLKDAIDKANEDYEDIPQTAKSQILRNNVKDKKTEVENDNNIDETMKFNFDDMTEKAMKKFEVDNTSEIEIDSETELKPDSEVTQKRKGKHF